MHDYDEKSSKCVPPNTYMALQNSSDENASITSAYESFCADILTAAKSHIGLKAVGMAGESWRTTEIFQAEIERDVARATSGIQSKQYKNRDAHLKRLVWERKAEIWERKVMKEKATNGRSSAISPQTKPLTLLVSSPKTAKIMSAQSRRRMHSLNCTEV